MFSLGKSYLPCVWVRTMEKLWNLGHHISTGAKGSNGILLFIFPCLLLLQHSLGICSFDLSLRRRSKQILLSVQPVSKPTLCLASAGLSGNHDYIWCYNVQWILWATEQMIHILSEKVSLYKVLDICLCHLCIFKIKLLLWAVLWVTSNELNVVQN